jgi:hypothetical protein
VLSEPPFEVGKAAAFVDDVAVDHILAEFVDLDLIGIGVDGKAACDAALPFSASSASLDSPVLKQPLPTHEGDAPDGTGTNREEPSTL